MRRPGRGVIFLLSSHLLPEARGICWPPPPLESARGILRHYNRPAPLLRSSGRRSAAWTLEPSPDSRRRGLRERASLLRPRCRPPVTALHCAHSPLCSMQQCPRALCSGMTISAQCDDEDDDVGRDRASPGSNEREGKRRRRLSR